MVYILNIYAAASGCAERDTRMFFFPFGKIRGRVRCRKNNIRAAFCASERGFIWPSIICTIRVEICEFYKSRRARAEIPFKFTNSFA